MQRVLWGPLLGSLLAFALPASVSWAGSGNTYASTGNTRENCALLDAQKPPQTPVQWFERSLLAGHCYRFDALAVRLGPGGFKTLAIHHDVHAEGERESVHFLDGPAEQFKREGRFLRNGWFERPSSGVHDIERQAVSQLSHYYSFTLDGMDRVADREAVVLSITPRDGMRYAHQLWLDRATALPLKQVVVNETGHILEAFQVSRLDKLALFKGTLQVGTAEDSPPYKPESSEWQVGWLPPGYEREPVEAEVDIDGTPMARQLFSDGLSSLSVFAGPLADATALREGVHRLGVLQAAVRHVEYHNQPYQIVVVGEVPTEVLTHIVTQVQRQTSPSS